MEGFVVLMFGVVIVILYLYKRNKNKWIAEQTGKGGYFLQYKSNGEVTHFDEYFETKEKVIQFVQETDLTDDIIFKEYKL